MVDGVVQMSRHGIGQAGIKLAKASAAGPIPLVQVPALIAPPLGARRAVAAPHPGVVREVRVVEGDAVRAGQTLAVVVSPTVMQTGADLNRARAHLDVDRSSAYRTGKLVEAGVIAGARAEQARASLRQSQTTVAENRRLLALAHADATSETYRPVAPLTGRVSTVHAALGQPIDNSAAPFIAGAQRAYALAAQLPQDYAGQVHKGMRVKVAPDIIGIVTAVGATVDENTRAVPLRASLTSAPGVMAGKTAMATILQAPPTGAVQVPPGALIQIEGHWAVFVPQGRGFAPHRVDLVGRNADRAVVTGLPLGATVVDGGATELKSAFTKG